MDGRARRMSDCWKYLALALLGLFVGGMPGVGLRVNGDDTPGQKAEKTPGAVAVSDPAEAEDDESKGLTDVAETEVRGRMTRVESNPELSGETKASILELFKSALDALAERKEFAARRRVLAEHARTADEDLAQVSQRRDAPRPAASSQIQPKASLAELQEGLGVAEATLEEWREKLAEAEGEVSRRATRRLEIIDRQPAVRQKLRELEVEIERGPGETDTEEEGEARQMLLRARQHAAEGERELLRQELLTYEATAELLSARRDLAAVEIEHSRALVEAWEEALNERRRDEVAYQVQLAALEVERVPAELRPLAERNQSLAELRRDLIARAEQASELQEKIEGQAQELMEEAEQVTRRARRAGFTETVAVVLRRRRESLPSLAELAERSGEQEHETAQVSLQLAELEEERSRLADLGAAVLREGRTVYPGQQDLDPRQEESIRSLLKVRRTALDTLIDDTTRYLETLMGLETAERELMKQTELYARFCDEHVLWIRSLSWPTRADLARVWQGLRELMRPTFWQQLGGNLANDVIRQPAIPLLLGLVLVGCWLAGPRAESKLKRFAATETETQSEASFVALGSLLFAAAPVPLVLYLLGSRIVAVGMEEGTAAGGRALQTVALLLFPLRMIRHGARLQRLVPGILQAGNGQVAGWRRFARSASWWGLPLLALTLWGTHVAGDAVRGALGRLTFLLLQGVLWWALRQLNGDTPETLQEKPDRTSGESQSRERFWRGAWRLLCVMVPALFAGLSLAGYHYTAVQLEVRLLGLVGLWGTVGLVSQLAGGWLLPRLRPITAGKSARAGKSMFAHSTVADTDPDALPTVENQLVQWHDLLKMASMGVYVLGAWAICRHLLPALRILETVELWPHPLRILDTVGEEPAAGLITLAGLCVAGLIAGVTWFCERTLPELLDVLVLSRTRLDPGARYAVATVCRYGVVLLGSLAAFQQLGIGWAQLNWLVAAMTVGLGFGLQEIFANFISGLILLMERPVRIGDIVSIGDVTGSVTRIRMRATTITDGDLRELIVPNKELITGRVINWTLTNTLSRLTIKVRAAVGTDPDLARALLLGVAQKHRLVLKQPAPSAQFEEFAENSLVFSLRVCVGNCDVVSSVRHELLTMIKREFQEAGIVTSVQPAKTGTFTAPLPGTNPVQPGAPAAAVSASPVAEAPRTSEAVPKPHLPGVGGGTPTGKLPNGLSNGS